jgi:hypothetical protein
VPAGDSSIVVRFSSFKLYMLHWALIAFFAGTFLYMLVLLNKEKQPASYV